MTPINAWANFLAHEKLDASSVDDEWKMKLVSLCEELAKLYGAPRAFASYQMRLLARELICDVAMKMGFDLPAIKGRFGKRIIGRGLLDVWNKIYEKKFGSTIGTAAARESKRRDIKIKLSKKNKNESPKDRFNMGKS